MKTIGFIALVLLVLGFAGCQDPLEREPILQDNNKAEEGKSEEENPDDLKLIPERTLMLYHQAVDIDPDETPVTIQDTFGRGEDGRYRITNSLSSANLSGTGFADALFMYYDTPLTGTFSIEARIQMIDRHGISASSSKGVFMGALVKEENGTPFIQASKVGGVMLRTTPAIRGYFTNANGGYAATGLNHTSGLDFGTEVILKFERTETGYVQTIINSATGSQIAGATTPYTVQMSSVPLHPDLMYDKPVYAGFAFMGVTAEVSQIKIMQGAETIFETPDSEPNPVGVEKVGIKVTGASATAHTEKPNTSVFIVPFANVETNGIDLEAVITPEYADEKGVTWQVVNSSPAGAITISAGGHVTVAKAGTADILMTTKDTSLADHILELIVTAYTPIESAAITGPDTLNKNTVGTYTAAVTPGYATNPAYKWAISGIGTIKGSAEGETVQVEAGSSGGTITLNLSVTTGDPDNSSSTVTKTAAKQIQVQANAVVPSEREWLFNAATASAAGLSVGTSNFYDITADKDFGNGLTVKRGSSNTAHAIRQSQASGGITGCFQLGGSNYVWATISGITGSFTIELKYSSTGSNPGRYPTIQIGNGSTTDFTNTDTTTLVTDTKTLTGDGSIITLSANNAIRIYSVKITQ